MQLKLRKLLPAFGLMCVSMFATASANTYNNSQSDSMSSSQGSKDMSGKGTYERGTYREITPTAGPRVAHGADVFITADFIYWKAVQDGLDYAITGVLGNGALLGGLVTVPPGITEKGSVSNPGFSFEPGFKIGLGLNLGHDGWDLTSEYTWYHSNQSNSTSGVGITNAVPAVSQGLLAFGDVKRNASWDLHFNVIDLELGRSFYVSQFLTLRPHAGLKATWQDQDSKTTISPSEGFVIGGQQQSQPNNPYVSTQDHDTWGIGTRIGLDTSWYFVKNWSIYADIAWTSMWTDYDVDRKDTLRLNDTDTVTFVNTNNSSYAVRFVGEFELGLRYEIWFYDDNYHFAIQAGWEQQVWVNYGNFIRLYNDVSGDLNMHGLNLKLRFDF